MSSRSSREWDQGRIRSRYGSRLVLDLIRSFFRGAFLYPELSFYLLLPSAAPPPIKLNWTEELPQSSPVQMRWTEVRWNERCERTLTHSGDVPYRPSCCRSAASPSLLATRSLSRRSVRSDRSFTSSPECSTSSRVSTVHNSFTSSVFTCWTLSTDDRTSTVWKKISFWHGCFQHLNWK